jgi:hypothetical protein
MGYLKLLEAENADLKSQIVSLLGQVHEGKGIFDYTVHELERKIADLQYIIDKKKLTAPKQGACSPIKSIKSDRSMNKRPKKNA